jgi:hypothetical protein
MTYYLINTNEDRILRYFEQRAERERAFFRENSALLHRYYALLIQDISFLFTYCTRRSIGFATSFDTISPSPPFQNSIGFDGFVRDETGFEHFNGFVEVVPPNWDDLLPPLELIDFGLPAALQERTTWSWGRPRGGVPSSTLAALPVAQASADDALVWVCAVCQTDATEGDAFRSLPCKHSYHVECIDTWLKSNRTCPLCKADVCPLEAQPVDDDEWDDAWAYWPRDPATGLHRDLAPRGHLIDEHGHSRLHFDFGLAAEAPYLLENVPEPPPLEEEAPQSTMEEVD